MRTHKLTTIPWILARHGLLGALYSGHNSTACGIGQEETLEIFVCPCSTTRWPTDRGEGGGRWKAGRGVTECRSHVWCLWKRFTQALLSSLIYRALLCTRYLFTSLLHVHELRYARCPRDGN